MTVDETSFTLTGPQFGAVIAALNQTVLNSVAALQSLQRQVVAQQKAAVPPGGQPAEPGLTNVGAPQANVMAFPGRGITVNTPPGDGAVAVEVINPAPAPNDAA